MRVGIPFYPFQQLPFIFPLLEFFLIKITSYLLTPVFSLVPDLLFDCSRILEYAKMRTVLQSTYFLTVVNDVSQTSRYQKIPATYQLSNIFFSDLPPTGYKEFVRNGVL